MGLITIARPDSPENTARVDERAFDRIFRDQGYVRVDAPVEEPDADEAVEDVDGEEE